MKNKINNINKDYIKRKKYLNNEIKKIIYQSIIQNLNVKPNIRSYAYKKLNKLRRNSFISRQTNNLCLKSGRFKGVLRLNQVSRHEAKKFGLYGFLQNIKIKSF